MIENPKILEQFKLKCDPKEVKIEMLEAQNADLIRRINLHREIQEQSMITIDDLSRENKMLRAWKDEIERALKSNRYGRVSIGIDYGQVDGDQTQEVDNDV